MCRILLVDDDPKIRAMLAMLLLRRGLGQVTQASDGAEALAVLARGSVDLIVTDCQMPRMDGISLVRTIRGPGDNTPIIMLSGQGDERVIEAALRAGVTTYMAKPVNPGLLIEAVRQLTILPTTAAVAGVVPAAITQQAA